MSVPWLNSCLCLCQKLEYNNKQHLKSWATLTNSMTHVRNWFMRNSGESCFTKNNNSRNAVINNNTSKATGQQNAYACDYVCVCISYVWLKSVAYFGAHSFISLLIRQLLLGKKWGKTHFMKNSHFSLNFWYSKYFHCTAWWLSFPFQLSSAQFNCQQQSSNVNVCSLFLWDQVKLKTIFAIIDHISA